MFGKIKKDFSNTVLKPAQKKSTMRLNRFLSNKYTVAFMILIIDIFFFCLINYVLNSIMNFKKWFQNMESTKAYFGLENFKIIELSSSRNTFYLYIIIFVVLLIIDGIFIYRIQTSYADKNFNVDQKGSQRWTTLEEIKEQYKAIPEREIEYDGYPGSIISRYKDKIFIDTSPVNNLILGITRSGKGEMYVVPSIEVYSRSKEKPSMIITDPKPELWKMCIPELERRGYECHVLNTIDPLSSMGYNPLELVVELYEENDFGRAELMANTFSHSIFNPDQETGNEKYFSATAAQVLTGIILAMTEDCLYEDKKLNDKRGEVFKRKKEKFISLDDEQQQQVRKEFSRKENNIQTQEQAEYIPEEIEFIPDRKYRKQVNMYSMMNLFTELSRQTSPDDDKTMLDIYFEQRPHLDRSKFRYAAVETAGDKTKGNVFSTLNTKLSIFTLENIAKMTAESSINLYDIGFGKKPLAIFLTTPDYDTSLHFLPTVFMRQVYYLLAKATSDTVRCSRYVKFVCDEIGNFPAIEGMKNIITVCLSRGISFDLYIQSFEQLRDVYGDASKTIISNCGNRIWILGGDKESAEEFSALAGNETITDIQRGGHKLALNKYITESNQERALLNANELMELEEGECVVKRLIKRRDLKGKAIRPRPIFNSRETGMNFKFRYEYLSDLFPNPQDVDIHKINIGDRSKINLSSHVYDYNLSFERFGYGKQSLENDSEYVMDTFFWETIDERLKELLGEEYKQTCDVTEYMTISEFRAFMDNSYIEDQMKRAILSLLDIGGED